MFMPGKRAIVFQNESQNDNYKRTTLLNTVWYYNQRWSNELCIIETLNFDYLPRTYLRDKSNGIKFFKTYVLLIIYVDIRKFFFLVEMEASTNVLLK